MFPGGVGAGSSRLCRIQSVVSDPGVGAGGAGGAEFYRGLLVFIPNICVLHVAVFGVSSYYMEKFNPGGWWVQEDPGGWCSVFVEKRTKKRKHGNVKIFL